MHRKNIKAVSIALLISMLPVQAHTVFADNSTKQETAIENGYSVLGTCIKEGGTSIYAKATTDSQKVGFLAEGGIIKVSGKTALEDGEFWYKVYYSENYDGLQSAPLSQTSASNLTGYVPESALLNGVAGLEKAITYGYIYAYVDEAIPIYITDTGDALMDYMYPRDILNVVGRSHERLQLTMYDGTKAYVNENQVTLMTDKAKKESDIALAQEKERKRQEEAAAVQGRQQITNNIIWLAKQYLGRPYVLGGNSLTAGIDCSGYVQQIYASCGVALPRYSIEQYGACTLIGRESIQPGDLVFYHGYYDGVPTEGVGHVAIYIGNGQIIHARSVERGICIDPIDTLPVVAIGRCY